MPGPVPKRSSQRRRVNKPEVEIASAPAPAKPKPLAASREWHPIARDWFRSLAKSGQAVFYEASDWATAYYLAEAMSRELKPKVVGTFEGTPVIETAPITGAALAAHAKLMAVLLVTEGDRRRLRIELERAKSVDEDEEAAVSALDDYRARFAN